MYIVCNYTKHKCLYFLCVGIEITRACVIQTSERCTDTTYDGISVTACTCNSDYCNQATDVHLKFPVLFIAVISTFVFKYLL